MVDAGYEEQPAWVDGYTGDQEAKEDHFASIPPSRKNCYCGGPEEIYPHQLGKGYYCSRDQAATTIGSSVPGVVR